MNHCGASSSLLVLVASPLVCINPGRSRRSGQLSSRLVRLQLTRKCGATMLGWATYAPHRENHHGCIVYDQCANELLKHAVEASRKRKPSPLKSLTENRKKNLPPMPKPGEVDIICGGQTSYKIELCVALIYMIHRTALSEFLRDEQVQSE